MRRVCATITMRFPFSTLVLLSLGLAQACQVLISEDLSGVHCEQEDFIGFPACPENETCQNGVCVGCSAVEICGDDFDNDCNGLKDDGCGDAGTISDADPYTDSGNNLDVWRTGSLVVLYSFLERDGDMVYDLSETVPAVNLRIRDRNSVDWLEDGGLQINTDTVVQSEGDASKIATACALARAITVEAWVEPDGLGQSGPDRIVSLSFDENNRNFTMGQENSMLDFRLRTALTGANGSEPSLRTEAGALQKRLMHIAYIRNDEGFAQILIDGEVKASGTIPGEMDNWDPSYPLLLGDELNGGRSWWGTYYLVAVYARALPVTDVQDKFRAGVPKGYL